MRFTSFLAAGLLAVSGVAVGAAPAHATITASFVSQVLTVTSDDAGDTMVFTCPSGAILLNGANPTGANLPCSAINSLVVLGNGGADTIDVSGLDASSVHGIAVDAGDGDDVVTGGGFTTGNTGTVTISGGPGNDVMIGHASDVVKGGPGDDILTDFGTPGQILDGETGNDTYRYDFTAAGQFTLDLIVLNGGLVAQGGLFYPWGSIEAVDLTMNEGNNAVSSFAFDGTARVLGNGGNDTLIGGVGADYLDAGSGNDTVTGGGGADQILAGAGDDIVRVNDQVADSVDCGAGSDIAVADPVDALAGCETVDIPPQPIPPDVTKPVPTVGKAKLQGLKVKVPVLCPATELRCVGSATLKATGKTKGKKQKISLGKVLVIADGGKQAKLVVKVDRATKKKLAKLTKAKLVVAYDVMDVAGNVAKGKATVTLKT